MCVTLVWTKVLHVLFCFLIQECHVGILGLSFSLLDTLEFRCHWVSTMLMHQFHSNSTSRTLPVRRPLFPDGSDLHRLHSYPPPEEIVAICQRLELKISSMPLETVDLLELRQLGYARQHYAEHCNSCTLFGDFDLVLNKFLIFCRAKSLNFPADINRQMVCSPESSTICGAI